MSRIGVRDLEEFIARAFVATHMSTEDAELASAALTRTEIRGFVSHGVRQVPRYIRSIQAGGVDPKASFDIASETPATALVDANAGLGHVVATKAMRLAVTKARAAGAGVVLARNSTHLGAVGIYSLLAAEEGMIGMAYTTTPRSMKGPGSRSAVVGNGPLGYAVPSRGAPFALDMAMSAVSGNRINMAKERGEPIPQGWIVDAQGRPSQNPDDYRSGGALVPIGDYKGFGLSLFGELLAGALAGLDWDSPEKSPTHQPGSTYFADLKPSDQWNAGHAFIAIDVAAFMNQDLFLDRSARLTSRIRTAAHVDSRSGIRIPGDRAHEREETARRDGVELTAGTIAALSDLATALGVAPPAFQTR